MTDADWDAGFSRSLGMFLNGNAISNRDDRGQPVVDDSFMILLNAHDESIDWKLLKQWSTTRPWEAVADTVRGFRRNTLVGQVKASVGARSMLILRRDRGDEFAEPPSY